MLEISIFAIWSWYMLDDVTWCWISRSIKNSAWQNVNNKYTVFECYVSTYQNSFCVSKFIFWRDKIIGNTTVSPCWCYYCTAVRRLETLITKMGPMLAPWTLLSGKVWRWLVHNSERNQGNSSSQEFITFSGAIMECILRFVPQSRVDKYNACVCKSRMNKCPATLITWIYGVFSVFRKKMYVTHNPPG